MSEYQVEIAGNMVREEAGNYCQYVRALTDIPGSYALVVIKDRLPPNYGVCCSPVKAGECFYLNVPPPRSHYGKEQ